MTSLPPLSRWTFYVATAGAALVSGALAMGRIESRAWAAGAVCGYLSLVAIGLKKPSLRMFTDALVRAHDGATIVVDVEHDPSSKGSIAALCALFEAHDARATLALTMDTAIAHSSALQAALERGHSVALVDRQPPERHERALSRGADLDARITELERDRAAWNEHFPKIPAPDLWFARGLYTPALQRLADTFDRTLVVASHDLRGPSRSPIAERVELELELGAILRVEDSPSFRAALPTVLAAAARLGVPVRALVSQDAAQEA